MPARVSPGKKTQPPVIGAACTMTTKRDVHWSEQTKEQNKGKGMYVGLKQPRGDGERCVTPARAAAKETNMKTVKKGRPPRKENRHVVQFGLLFRLECRIPGLLQVKTLLLQSSSRVQMPLTRSCIHIVTRTCFRMQITVCSKCHASVCAYGALAVIIVVVFDDLSAFQFH